MHTHAHTTATKLKKKERERREKWFQCSRTCTHWRKKMKVVQYSQGDNTIILFGSHGTHKVKRVKRKGWLGGWGVTRRVQLSQEDANATIQRGQHSGRKRTPAELKKEKEKARGWLMRHDVKKLLRTDAIWLPLVKLNTPLQSGAQMKDAGRSGDASISTCFGHGQVAHLLSMTIEICELAQGRQLCSRISMAFGFYGHWKWALLWIQSESRTCAVWWRFWTKLYFTT